VKLLVTGQFFDPSGYGEFARLIAWALHEQGHEVFARCWNTRPEDPSRFGHKGELVKSLLREPPSGIDGNVVVYVPLGLKRLHVPDVPNVMITMHESDHLKGMYSYELNRWADAVLVPSAWNQRVFQAEVDKPVGIVHPPLDVDLALPVERWSRRAEWPFDFVSIFQWGAFHKNPGALVKAFCTAFSCRDPVRLVIKTAGKEEDIRDAMGDLLAPFADPPEIRVVLGSMTRAQTTELMEQAHCYVSSHRGEGWGLPIFEAMGLGLPAIATDFAAPLEFMDRESSWLVPYEYDDDLGHAEVDVGELAQAMRYVFEHQDQARDAALEAQSKLVRRFTTGRTEAQIVNAVEVLASEASSPATSVATV
jgi:glycosyltransferase involved in cell wall biosynthesis